MRKEFPRLGASYSPAEFVQRFSLMCRTIEMLAQIQQFDEAWGVAEQEAAFVWTEAADTDPFLGNLAGQLLWTLGDAFAAENYFFDALERYLCTCRLLRKSDMPLEEVAGYAVATAARCINLIESGTPRRTQLLDLATEALSLVDEMQTGMPGVLTVRFEVARLRGDRRELRRLASLVGSYALDHDQRRVADLLARLSSDHDWYLEFGPFAPAIYAHCHTRTQADGFAHFDGDDALPIPTTGSGYRAARLGHVTFAEPQCDEITGALNTWLGAAAERQETYVIEGVTRLVRRTVPTAAMHTLVSLGCRPPSDLPESLRFIFDRGAAAAYAEPVLIHDWIDRTLAFLDGDTQHEAVFTCAGILVGAVQALLPMARMRHYISALEVMSGHREALRAAWSAFPRAKMPMGEDA